jgi:hypothetical protein
MVVMYQSLLELQLVQPMLVSLLRRVLVVPSQLLLELVQRRLVVHSHLPLDLVLQHHLDLLQ